MDRSSGKEVVDAMAKSMPRGPSSRVNGMLFRLAKSSCVRAFMANKPWLICMREMETHFDE
ncbi:MAG: hypothetical protein EAZ81_00965 [Verrucomicrobia bacterium]|nr:MAG: hypothetical protein EAZ81_00965 [Verrucomicrobiota bacterium]